ncbi:uncharacterized protein LOC129969398 [Argiope bruennichi]|uniref:uncharacterized protein LOC129969398 n=1 Tax=Argiope bruennichi TaxID=94029 RepID=UPI002494AA9F|nr:uncharacterized protein LOC129969398 [Argiope bruennichi]
MRNLFSFLLLASVLTTLCSATGRNPNQPNPNSKHIETFSSRYALPTNDPALIAKMPFTFGYRFTDDYGTMQAREEKTDPNGSKTGSYSFVDASGNYRRVDYVADVHGFRATVRTNEPGIFPENPAHVRVSIDNSKNLDLPIQQSIKNSPQLEYSSHILSHYNHTTNHGQGKGGLLRSQQNTGFGYKKQPQDNRGVFAEDIPRRPVPQNEPVFRKNVNYYKGSPFPERQPVRAVLLSELELPNPETYPDSQRLGPKEFFNSPSINPDFGFDDKIANTGYDNSPTFSLIPNPTRYPRRLRDSRTRKRQRYEYKIHIPRGYENHPDLPLYRDK